MVFLPPRILLHLSFVIGLKAYRFLLVCVHLHAYVCARMNRHIQVHLPTCWHYTKEINTGCLPLLLFTLCFEAGSVPNLGARLDWLVSIPSISVSPAGRLQACSPSPHFCIDYSIPHFDYFYFVLYVCCIYSWYMCMVWIYICTCIHVLVEVQGRHQASFSTTLHLLWERIVNQTGSSSVQLG